VRGEGLLLAFELVSDRQTMQPLPKALNAYSEVGELAYAEGLIIYSRRTRGGVDGDHFLVCPPMITSVDQVDEIIDMLTSALDKFAAKAGLAERWPDGRQHVEDHHILRRHRLDPHALDVTLSASDSRGIAEQAIGAAKAGAAILHLHARDPGNGRPSASVAHYMAFLPAIKAGPMRW
jgi:hypothetical protein